jgi:hypothetical protein
MIVIGVGLEPDPMLPVTPFEVCEPRVTFQLRKNVSGVIPVVSNAGRSAIHSALSFSQVVQDCVVEKLLPGVVASVSRAGPGPGRVR